MDMPKQKRHIGFILLDNFSMIAFSNAVESFRMANYVSARPLYRFSVAGLNGGYTVASNGLSVNHTAEWEDLSSCDVIFVCGGFDLSKLHNSALRNILQRLAKQGMALGGVCTGAFALADAGLLDGYQASIHWENMLTAKETFPQVCFNTTIYTIDRNRYTCSGGTASLDLCIQLIRLHHDRALSDTVAEQFTLSVLRGGDEAQHIPISKQQHAGYGYITEALVLMDKNLEDPLPIHEIAQLLGISVRQLERLFNQYLSKPPQLYYMEVRLQHAKRLLKQTNKSIMDIALACGFANPSSFSKAYRSQFSHTPSQTRKQASAA